ncbi:hypothetical protein [Nocardioides limicola]|uniref:hypothetical protein n=1 Tax=Nocardioides limicola TaxID=2803368 RepID=UPI001EEF9C97|nr:hypothetical protein [Nocardioides sp. DJM-14]
MNLQSEALSRAQHDARLGEAQQQRAEQHLAHQLRVAREAERRVHQARLAIARSLI